MCNKSFLTYQNNQQTFESEGSDSMAERKIMIAIAARRICPETILNQNHFFPNRAA
jgi:hypothetical protein